MLRISLAQKLTTEKRKRSTFNARPEPMANMIVVESAREHLEISFWDCARWNSYHGPDECCRYPCATRVALSNRPFCARERRVPAGAVKALLPLWSMQTTVAGERFASAQDGDTQQA